MIELLWPFPWPVARMVTGDQAIFVAFNIEHIEIVTHRVYGTEHLSQFVKIRPIAFSHDDIPVVQLILHVFVLIGKLSYRSVADDDHGGVFYML